MQKKYGKDGVVVVSVSLDDPAEKDIQKKVRAFLEKQQATFPNYFLNEAAAVWQDKNTLNIEGPPAVYVFERDGRLARKIDTGDTHAKAEKLVQEMLKK